MAPASVPPEYWPEHVVVEELVTMVVVACRAASTGVAGRRGETRVGGGAWQKHERLDTRAKALRIPL